MNYERQVDCVVCGHHYTQTRDYLDVEFPDGVEHPAAPEVEPVCRVCQNWQKRRRASFVAARGWTRVE